MLSRLYLRVIEFGLLLFFFFNDTATTEIYTLSLHDALPISFTVTFVCALVVFTLPRFVFNTLSGATQRIRSEEHTSELQSQSNLVCRLLLEKKKKIKKQQYLHTQNGKRRHGID